MLTKLTIRNFALIESLEVDFKDSLSIITGETGAGKSILLGALGLVLGKRADFSALNNKEQKCVIEAEFSIANYNLQSFFENRDIDYESLTILRREILPSGKSRAFINDTPTNLTVLQELSENLIDIHSQHQTLQLSDAGFQFQILDALASNQLLLTDYNKVLITFKELQNELALLKQEQNNASQQYQYNLHLYNELEKAAFNIDEQEQLEQLVDKLSNIEEIKLNLSEAIGISTNEEFGLQTLIQQFKNKLLKIATYDKEYSALAERVNSISIELDDISQEIDIINEQVNYNPNELEQVNDRLELIYNLQKKHSVGSITELLRIQEVLEEKINVVEMSSFNLAAKEKEVAEVKDKLESLATKIHQKRKAIIPNLQTKIVNMLSVLGMKNSHIKFVLTDSDHYYSNGKDTLEVLFSANKGADYNQLKKVASGGELSRIMLSIKAILSKYSNLPTVIFDEIDTGVSGEVANQVAEIMKEMSSHMQVITITHLPQIAAKGAHHYKVYKQDVRNITQTLLKKLNENERIVELAEMLEGKNSSETAIEHAKQLLN